MRSQSSDTSKRLVSEHCLDAKASSREASNTIGEVELAEDLALAFNPEVLVSQGSFFFLAIAKTIL